METIAQPLVEIIEEQGIEYLQRKPYEVYCKMISAGADEAYARLVLITLLSGASIKAREMDVDDLSKDIQKECYLRKKMADEISAMYGTLFNAENISTWKKRKHYGFRIFL